MTDATQIRRRAFFGRSAAGLGLVALNSLLPSRLFGARTTIPSLGAVNPLDFAPKAKRHLPVPGRWAFAPGNFRLQAEAA
jgi:hypothetical protein